MTLVQLCLLLVGSLAIGAVVAWALNGITAMSQRSWDAMVARDETDPEQVDQVVPNE